MLLFFEIDSEDRNVKDLGNEIVVVMNHYHKCSLYGSVFNFRLFGRLVSCSTLLIRLFSDSFNVVLVSLSSLMISFISGITINVLSTSPIQEVSSSVCHRLYFISKNKFVYLLITFYCNEFITSYHCI